MPSFDGWLTEAQIEALAAYVLELSGRQPSRRSLKVSSAPKRGARALAQGKRLYQRLGCVDCHGEDGAGVSGPGGVLPTNLQKPWTFKGGAEPVDIALRVLAGIEGTDMHGLVTEGLRADQLYALSDYVLSLRQHVDLRAAAAHQATAPPGADEPLLARGQRLVQLAGCAECHTPIDNRGHVMHAYDMAGGRRIDVKPFRTVVSSNLTPHATGLGGWTEEQFATALRTGQTPGSRQLDAWAMPWPHYAAMTDADVRAVFHYLRSLRPVDNTIPRTEPIDGLGAVWERLQVWRGAASARLVFHAGNAGAQNLARRPEAASAKPLAGPRRLWRTLALASTLGLVVEALYFWQPIWMTGLRRRRRRRKTLREYVRGPIFVGSVALAAALVTLAWWPPSGSTLDPAASRQRLAPDPPAPVEVDGNDRRIAERGAYLVQIAGCGRCHTSVVPVGRATGGQPLAGGTRLSWEGLGVRYPANLTADPATGLGEWSAAELRRLLTSGLRSDLTIVPRQAMPWQRTSRLTPEEMESVVAYLKAMPAVTSLVPPSTASGGDELLTWYPLLEAAR